MRLPRGFGVVLSSLAFSLLPTSLFGQFWSVDTYVGKASYETAPTNVDSRTAVFGIRFNEDRRIFQATAGAPFSSSDVTWGVAEFGDRFALYRGGLVTGADFSILAHAQRDPVADVSGKGLLGEALPMISHNVGAAVLEFRSGLRWYGARLGNADWTRTLWASDFRASIEPDARFRLEGEVRHDRGKLGENYTRPGASVTAALTKVLFRASVGDWINNPNEAGPEWGLSVGIPITSRVWAVSAARRETFDPTFLVSPRTSWGVGLSFQVGGPASPSADRGNARERTSVILRVPLRDAGTAPFVAGDFTNWKPVRMTRYEHEWRFTANLVSGVYHFAFRNDRGEWFVPEGFPNRMDDGMGGKVAVVVIP